MMTRSELRDRLESLHTSIDDLWDSIPNKYDVENMGKLTDRARTPAFASDLVDASCDQLDGSACVIFTGWFIKAGDLVPQDIKDAILFYCVVKPGMEG